MKAFQAELTILGEGQDATAFSAEVLTGAIRALVLIATGPQAEDDMLQRLRSFHLIFAPMELLEKLAALTPPERIGPS